MSPKAELEGEFRKLAGRVVLRSDIVKKDPGNYAFFVLFTAAG